MPAKQQSQPWSPSAEQSGLRHAGAPVLRATASSSACACVSVNKSEGTAGWSPEELVTKEGSDGLSGESGGHGG